MSNNKFLHQLQNLAQQQSQLPLARSRYSAFFWQHAWKIWLLLAFASGILFENLVGRCP